MGEKKGCEELCGSQKESNEKRGGAERTLKSMIKVDFQSQCENNKKKKELEILGRPPQENGEKKRGTSGG